MKIEVPTSWYDVPWNLFEEISAIGAANLEDSEKEIMLISKICGISVEEVMDLDAASISAIDSRLQFLREKPEKKMPSAVWECRGRRFRVDLYPAAFKASQFIDYKVISGMEIDRKIARLICCFLYPEGKEYNEGYDLEEVVDYVNTNMSVPEVTGYADFFMLQYRAYADSLAGYSMRLLKRSGIPRRERRRIAESLRKGRDLIRSFGT